MRMALFEALNPLASNIVFCQLYHEISNDPGGQKNRTISKLLNVLNQKSFLDLIEKSLAFGAGFIVGGGFAFIASF